MESAGEEESRVVASILDRCSNLAKLQVNCLTGRLYTRGVIDYDLMTRLGELRSRNSEQRDALIAYLRRTADTAKLEEFRVVVEQSKYEDVIPFHEEISKEILRVKKEVLSERPSSRRHVTLSSKDEDYVTDEEKEYPKLVKYIRYLFDAGKEDDIVCFNCCRCIRVRYPIRAPQHAGVLNTRTHAELVCTLVRLRSSNVEKAKLAVQVVNQKDNIPDSLKIAGVVVGTPSTSDSVGVLNDALTRINACSTTRGTNVPVLQLRVHAAFFQVYYWSKSRNVPKTLEHIQAAMQLMRMCDNDYASVQTLMMKALLIADEKGVNMTEDEMIEAHDLAAEAVERVEHLPHWTKVFTSCIKMDKLKVDLTLAKCYQKLGNNIAVKVTLRSVYRQLEQITLDSLPDADIAYFYSIYAVASHIEGKLEKAEEFGTKACNMFIQVGWFGGAFWTAKQIESESLLQKVLSWTSFS
jgi:hypothetical protein